MAKVYYTGSCNLVIPVYADKEKGDVSGARIIKKAITIAGGANVAFSDPEKVTRKRDYAVTEVSDADLKLISSNPAFMRKEKAGFITINKVPASNPDKSAQLTESEVKKTAPKATVSTGSTEDE